MNRSSIALMAIPHYSFDRPYHNFGHALKVLTRCEELMRRCERYGIDFIREAVVWAALGHDEEFGADFKALGFQTMEQMSAAVMTQDMEQQKIADTVVNIAADAVVATHWQSVPQSVEAKILRAADLWGLGGDFREYMVDRDRVMREAAASDEVIFTKRNLTFLATYVWPEIRLTSEYADCAGRSIWHTVVVRNFALAYQDCWMRHGMEPCLVLDADAGHVPGYLLRANHDELVIGLAGGKVAKEWAESQLASLGDPKGPPEVWLPGTLACIPAPDHFFDEVMMSEAKMVSLAPAEKAELARVTAHAETPITLK